MDKVVMITDLIMMALITKVVQINEDKAAKAGAEVLIGVLAINIIEILYK